MNFAQIIRQLNVVEYLKKSLENNKIAHALLFDGENGMGKMMVSSIYSQALFCSSENKPCNKCSSCRKFVAGIHPDFRIIEPDKKKSITTDDISQLLSGAYIIPREGKRKVFVIQKAHLMTPAAQNKLLKILEEPPEYLVIMLLCDNISSILQTIISRSITLKMQRVSDGDIKKILKENGIDESKIEEIAIMASGNIGTALTIAKNEKIAEKFNEYRQVFFEIEKSKINTFKYLDNNKNEAKEILLCWQKILSDCIEMKSKNINQTLNRKEIKFANDHTIDDIINKLDFILETESRLTSNAQYLPTVDWLLANL